MKLRVNKNRKQDSKQSSSWHVPPLCFQNSDNSYYFILLTFLLWASDSTIKDFYNIEFNQTKISLVVLRKKKKQKQTKQLVYFVENALNLVEKRHSWGKKYKLAPEPPHVSHGQLFHEK